MQSYQASARIGNLTKMPDSLMDFAKEGKKLPMVVRIVYIIWILLWLFPLILAFTNIEYAKLACIGIMGMNFVTVAVKILQIFTLLRLTIILPLNVVLNA